MAKTGLKDNCSQIGSSGCDRALVTASIHGANANGAIVSSRAKDHRADTQLFTRARQQEAVATLGQLALGGMDIVPLINRAAELVTQILEVEYCEVLKLLPGGKQLLLQAGAGWKKGCVGRVKVNVGSHSHGGYTLVAQQPIVVGDFRREARFRASALLREHQVFSGLSVIILGRSSPYGVLGAHSRTRRQFSGDDIHFLQAISNVLAQAIERKRIEQERLLLAEVVEFSDDAIIARRLDGTILSWNRGAEQIFGYQASEAVGHPFGILVPPDRLPEAEEIQLRIARGERVQHYETMRVKKGGTFVPVSLTTSPILDTAGKTTGISTIARDLTKRKQLEAEIIEVNEAVQFRVGQDLHDGLMQRLRGISYLAHVLQRNLADQSLPGSGDARRITELLDEALAETRNVARGLSPVRLEADGLMSGLKELAAITSGIYGISCRFICPRPVLIKQNATAIHLYRIAQEGVQNAIQHGRARRVVISLAKRYGNVELTVRDDGLGMPKPKQQGNGMGLKIMDYRARTIGAVLNLHPAPGAGTLLTCSLRIETNHPGKSLCAPPNR